ncbi:MAG: transglutaminaseTgpA domain-containing protein [Thiolinea sp.]
MIVIFIFTPRLQPFWSLPLLLDQAKSGISDRMAPGDDAKLTLKSGQLAFRVTFKGNVRRVNCTGRVWC